jgi:hypothetical protein
MNTLTIQYSNNDIKEKILLFLNTFLENDTKVIYEDREGEILEDLKEFKLNLESAKSGLGQKRDKVITLKDI